MSSSSLNSLCVPSLHTLSVKPRSSQNTIRSYNVLSVTSSTQDSCSDVSNTSFRAKPEFITEKMKPYFQKLQAMERPYNRMKGKNDMDAMLTLKDLNDELIEICGEILHFYDIKLTYLSELKSDSALKVFPLSPSVELYSCLKSMIDTIKAFPHSFFYKLGINTITLCDDIVLLKAEHKEIYKQKLLRGLIAIKSVHDEREMSKCIYMMILGNMHQKIGDLHGDWVSNFWPMSTKKDSSRLSSVLLEDQYKAMEYLMAQCGQDKKRSDEKLRSKAKKMKEYLSLVDLDLSD